MKNFAGTAVKASLMLVALCGALGSPCQAQTPAADSARKPVLVELFTAEGCSSCPPAEAIALKMEKQPLAGIDLIVLEEHVTYWNQYGWIDPFSSGDWTERQTDYIAKLPHESPYTPEMVVDGQAQFTGSNGRAAQAAIENAVRAPETDVTIADAKADPKNEEDFQVSVGKLQGGTPGDVAEVWVAVTEDGLHSDVKAGENAGHTLYHAAVLRYLHKIGVADGSGATAFTGDARVKFKSSWNRKDVNIVAFVQEKKSLKVLGAASTKLEG
ncbi:MAG: DUF1223 domain-containing protein [Candidatus Acidiferrales bacterium]